MTITDPTILYGLAAMISASACVIWAIRRRP